MEHWETHESKLQSFKEMLIEVVLSRFSAIYLDLKPNQTYQFKYKHGSQYFVDEKYPTVINPLGTLNNLIVVYNKKIEV